MCIVLKRILIQIWIIFAIFSFWDMFDFALNIRSELWTREIFVNVIQKLYPVMLDNQLARGIQSKSNRNLAGMSPRHRWEVRWPSPHESGGLGGLFLRGPLFYVKKM